MNEITIHIRESSNEDGFMYDIYDVAPDDVDNHDSIDGGLCTTNIKNALKMAYEQTIGILPLYCPRCKEDWTNVKKINKGALVDSECMVCGVCKNCEHLSNCSKLNKIII